MDSAVISYTEDVSWQVRDRSRFDFKRITKDIIMCREIEEKCKASIRDKKDLRCLLYGELGVPPESRLAEKTLTYKSRCDVIDHQTILYWIKWYTCYVYRVFREPSITIFDRPIADDQSLVFHGTIRANAYSILHEGIQLLKGYPFQDFSDGYGFYLMYSFQNAMKWAIRKSSMLLNTTDDFNQMPVVVAFWMDKQVLERYRCRNLDTNTEWWTEYVSSCRTGSIVDVDDGDVYTYTKGPLCENGNDAFLGQTPKALPVQQICIHSQKLANRIHKRFYGIMTTLE